MKLVFSICILLFFCVPFGFQALAQNKPNRSEHKDSVYIKRDNYVLSARNKLTIFLFSSRYLNGILFTNPGMNSYYFPIAPVNIGIGFSHKWLAINVALVSPRIGTGNYDGHGTKYDNFNFQLLAYTPKYGLDILYGQNLGYFLGNYQGYVDLNGAPETTPYFDMNNRRFTINVLRVFNPIRYSMNAAMVGGEMQKNSASSFILNSIFSVSGLNMSDSIPDYVLQQINPDAIFKHGTFYSLGILPGYAFTWIIRKRIYIGIIPALGPSIQFKDMNFEGSSDKRFALSYRVLAKVGAGFHAKRWTAGVTVLFDSEQYHLADQTNIINNSGKVTLRIGYKINVPKWGMGISKKMSDVQNRVEDTLHNF